MDQREFYIMEASQVCEDLHTSMTGLDIDERKKRQEIYGQNILQNLHKKNQLLMFFLQFKDLMIVLLIVSSGIALVLNDVSTAIILGAIVLINACIGFFQEAKAEHELESLKKMVSTKAKVKIGGLLQEVGNISVVPGDIIFLEAGDAVPADIRILEEQNLQTNDFSLTGESNPKKKHAHRITESVELGDRTNLAFMGTTVAMGRARGVVIGTGMDTEIGKIASLSTEVKVGLSPMQMEMKHVAKRLTTGTLLLGVALFFITLGLDFTVKNALLFALGIAAAMVPQGLPAQISIALTSAVMKLTKKNALVKKLSSVETLGAVQIICTDKTGTLTKNEMTVTQYLLGNQIYTVTGIGYEPVGGIVDKSGQKLIPTTRDTLFLRIGVLASNAHVHSPDEEHATWYTIGDPTEGALLTLAAKIGLDQEKLENTYPLVKEYSFDSGRKRMSCVRKDPEGKYVLYIKGSVQTMLERATHYFDGEKVRPITEQDKQYLVGQQDERAQQAMRNLCYGYRTFDQFDDKTELDEAERDLTILGVVSMIDPPREEVMGAVEAAYESGIHVFVITGDYALTAEAIAHRIGLDQHTELEILEGKILRDLSDVEVINKLASGHALIFSRVSPEDKVRIVKLCKRMGKLVAVTGDGVNDAPALKNADIGVAMGKTGTDVAKEAAEIILLDDSFATLVAAIQQGRLIYENIKKIVLCCITTNITELTIILMSLLLNAFFGWPLALLAVQILAIDLMGEMFSLAALAWDPPVQDMLKNKPRNIHEHILNSSRIKDLIISGLIMGLISYSMYIRHYVVGGVTIGNFHEGTIFHQSARSLVYLTVVLSQYMNILSRRSGDLPLLSPYLRSNKKLLRSFVIGLSSVLFFVYLPFFNTYFGTGPLAGYDWLLAILGSLLYLAYRERRRKKEYHLCR